MPEKPCPVLPLLSRSTRRTPRSTPRLGFAAPHKTRCTRQVWGHRPPWAAPVPDDCPFPAGLAQAAVWSSCRCSSSCHVRWPYTTLTTVMRPRFVVRPFLSRADAQIIRACAGILPNGNPEVADLADKPGLAAAIGAGNGAGTTPGGCLTLTHGSFLSSFV